MFRSIGRTVLEIARAIDTGHAIRHGVRPRVPRTSGPEAPPSAAVTAGEPFADPDPRL